MVLRVVPDDNSCMFTSLAIVLEHDRPGAPGKLRQGRHANSSVVLCIYNLG